MDHETATSEGSPHRANVELLYPFRFVDPRTGRWVRARYRATRRELEQRYAQWEITGEGEISHLTVAPFEPFR